MKNRRNYYRILQVQHDATTEVIRASYRTLMLKMKNHPDLGGSAEQASLLNEAYEVLSDRRLRADYDRRMRLGASMAAGAGQRSSPGMSCPVCAQQLSRKPAPGERCRTCATPLQSEKPQVQQRTYQRAIARTRKDQEIQYYSMWPGVARKARMIDFSPRGMRFFCGEKLRKGMNLKISCEILEASAQVTNVREEIADGENVCAVGISFLAVTFLESRGSLLSTSA
jgi:curved DNA-binding protein CbpA